MTEKEMLEEAKSWLSFIASLEMGINEHLKDRRYQTLKWLIEQNEGYRQALIDIAAVDTDSMHTDIEAIQSIVRRAVAG